MASPRCHSFTVALLVICVTMTSSKRTSRRNWRGAADLETLAADEEGVCELEVSCRNGGDGVPIRLPIRGPKGPSGEPGTPGLPGKPGPAGESGSSSMEENPRIAFFVGLNANPPPIKKNSDLIFDKVITNVGEAFNPKTGRFTAPINGTFQFTITAAAQGRQRAAVEIVRNKKMVATVWAESIPFWASATTSVILSLETGDQVWAIILARAPHLHGYMYTSFSGHCLFRGF